MFKSCPICGFAEMPYEPVPFNICPCCGTEFGVDDRRVSHSALRLSWVTNGAPWFDDIILPHRGWNPLVQLANAGFETNLWAVTGHGIDNKRFTVSLGGSSFSDQVYEAPTIQYA